MNQPRRAENPKKFLDASLVPLERALNSRAEVLIDEVLNADEETIGTFPYSFKCMLRDEYLRLAEELHHW